MKQYDESNPMSIESYAKKLIGKTFRQAVGNIEIKSGNKGGLGQILEQHYFGYDINSNKEADFKEAGVELKATPYKINGKKKNVVAKERLVLTIINYLEDYKYNLYNSHFYEKNKLILIIYYLYEKELDRLDYPINYVQLFQFPEKDLKIIENDYNKIIAKIKSGKAHELSEGDTNYLGACTKGANSESVRNQPFSEKVAQQRAFCLKTSYMTHILNEYLIPGITTYIGTMNSNYEMSNELNVAEEYVNYIATKTYYDDSIVKNVNELEDTTFEEFVLNKINRYKGHEISDLAQQFNVTSKPTSKNYAWNVAMGMLGVKGTKIEEFEKANIKVKAIRIEKNGSIKEHMSFPTFKYNEIINETWETSELREYFNDTRFLFVIYKHNENNKLVLEKAMFWNLPENVLENEVYNVWYETVNKIRIGEYDDLPKSTYNKMCHVRPHARNGDDTYPTPNGGQAIKKCFWLDRRYILDEINK